MLNRIQDADPEGQVLLGFDRVSAERFARAMRELTAEPRPETLEMLEGIGYEVGALLGLTSNTDDTDPIDEHLNTGDDIQFVNFIGTSNVPIFAEVTLNG